MAFSFSWRKLASKLLARVRISRPGSFAVIFNTDKFFRLYAYSGVSLFFRKGLLAYPKMPFKQYR